MITDTRERILEIIHIRGQARVHELAQELSRSTVAIHKQLQRLRADGLIEKRGTPPLVFYVPSKITSQTSSLHIQPNALESIQSQFLSITPDGHMLYGLEGFAYWAKLYGKGKSVDVLASEYREAIEKKQGLAASEGWIDATPKLTSTFPDSKITRLLFSDIYSIPVFGRTRLAKLVMHAKTSQDKNIMISIVDMVRPMVEEIIATYHIQAVGYIPPTVPRQVQFIDELRRLLGLSLPEIEISKVVAGTVSVPQKSLTSTADRIINARESMYPKNTTRYPFSRILLLDDVVGSGASFNEVATKILPLCLPPGEITACAIVGNIKGYEVIRQI